jgi:hypothetical protein
MIGYHVEYIDIANPYLGTDLANLVENHPSPDAHAEDVYM